MRSLLFVAALCVAGCTPEERADIGRDIENYNHGYAAGRAETLDEAPIGPPAIEVIADTAATAATKAAQGPEALIAWIVGLVGTVAAGYVTRKFIKRKYSNAIPK